MTRNRRRYVSPRHRESVAVAWIMGACAVVFAASSPALLYAGRVGELHDAPGYSAFYTLGLSAGAAAIASVGLVLLALYDRFTR